MSMREEYATKYDLKVWMEDAAERREAVMTMLSRIVDAMQSLSTDLNNRHSTVEAKLGVLEEVVIDTSERLKGVESMLTKILLDEQDGA